MIPCEPTSRNVRSAALLEDSLPIVQHRGARWCHAEYAECRSCQQRASHSRCPASRGSDNRDRDGTIANRGRPSLQAFIAAEAAKRQGDDDHEARSREGAASHGEALVVAWGGVMCGGESTISREQSSANGW